jgi:copper transport protein
MTPRMLLVLLLMAVSLAFGPRAAMAHASLTAAEPPDGAMLQEGPDRIVLHFSEPVSPLVLRLIRPQGEAIDLDRAGTQHPEVEITPPAALDQGTYALSWRVVSADGHPISGSLVFSIGTPTPDRHPDAVRTGRPVQVALWGARLFMYLGAFVGVGGALFAAWIADRGTLRSLARRGILVTLWGGVPATALSIGLQGLDALALPLRALASGATWLQGLDTSFGATALVVLISLSCGLLSLGVRADWQAKSLSAGAMIGVGLAFAASGHASTAEPHWLTRTSVVFHVTGFAFWIGALLPLLAMVRRTGPGDMVVMKRFSAAILPVVAVLLLSGVVLAVVQVGSGPALWGTLFGRILLAKLLAVGGLLVLAAVNRVVFTPAMALNGSGRRTWFVRSIAAEGVLVVLILGLAAGWRFTPPPRADAATPRNPSLATSGPITAHLHTREAMARISLDQGERGRTGLTIKLASASGALLSPKEVVLGLSKPSSGIEPFERHAVQVAPGTWRVDEVVLPAAGEWRVQIDALVSDFDKLILEGTLDTGSRANATACSQLVGACGSGASSGPAADHGHGRHRAPAVLPEARRS